ncbi:putative lysM domain protein, partial [Chlamydia psittaci 84-8471/1]
TNSKKYKKITRLFLKISVSYDVLFLPWLMELLPKHIRILVKRFLLTSML